MAPPSMGGGKVHRNLAQGCKAEASTAKSEERAASNVVDGSPVTRWTSLYEDGQWITIDLGAVYTLSEVRIRWEMACAESYLIQGSNDGASFNNLAQECGHEGWVVTGLPTGVQARWVRMFGQTRATSFGFSIWDMQVMGTEVEGGQAAPTLARGGPAMPSVASAARPGAPQGFGGTWWDVVYDRVAVRAGPSTKAKMLSAAKKGEGFRGSKIVVEGQPWLRLDEAWVEECRTDITIPKGVEGLWVLIDGKSVGLGELLRPGVEPPETANLARGGPKAKANAAPAKAAAAGPKAASQSAMNSVKVKVPTPQPFMPESEWVVAHDKVVERAEPNVNASAKKIREKDELVKGTPCYVGNSPWLRLDGTWILMDGRSAGVPGKLLVPAADIAQDIMRWAEQHKNSEAGKRVTWNEQTDAELQRIQEVAEKQVELLRPMVEFPQVVQRLEQDGFILSDDFTLGPDGIVKAVRRKLLRMRAGVVVLGEERKDERSPWNEEDFPKYLSKIIPDAPFYCRTYAPEEAPTRLLILLHGSLVCGDDLVAEAEALRRMMPETAVVLPEGPVLASKELGLRVWWTPPEDAPKDVSDIRDARNHGLLKAPEAAISRTLATVKWAHERYKGVPYVLGGFSQGSMLVAQSLSALKAQGLLPHGVVILSGLAVPFVLPPKVSALALHGDQDERIELGVAREVAKEGGMEKVKLEEIPGMGHEISDTVIDRIVRFCDEAAPVVRTVAPMEESEWIQEVNQAKLLRWVKKVSQVITMFDDNRFMSHIVHLNMLGLGTDCPGLGKGPLFRYYVHDAGPQSRGTVVLFHGKVYDLRRETRNLVEGYKRLKLSVAVIDYRQKFSQFCVDATVVLESLGEITGSETSPVIVHATGCGAIAGLHMAIAAHAYPAAVRRRLRLLVLDGAVGNFRSLPPSPTGCIATDPIGNDEKLKYIGLPLALFGGDDHCCGLKWSAGHWTVLSRQAEALLEDKKLPALTMNTGTVVVPSITEARLAPDLYRACEGALDAINRSSEAAQKFAEDVLSSADITDQSEFRKFKEEDLKNILMKVLEEMEKAENKLKLWYVRAEREPKRGEELTKFIAVLHLPLLEAHGGFREGFAGFHQFDSAVNALAELNHALRQAKEKVREAFNIKKLEEQALKYYEEKDKSLGVTLDQCHGIMDSAIAEWKSQALFDRLEEEVRAAGGTPMLARKAVKEQGLAMNAKRAKQLGFEGSDDEMNMKLGVCFNHYQGLDPTLQIKMHEVQEGVMKVGTRMHELFKAKPAAKALANGEAKEPPQDVQVFIEHAMEGGSMNLVVKSNATMMEVRRAIMTELGETKLSQVKLVSRMNGDSGFRALADDQPLGLRRQLLMMGRSLPEAEAVQAAEPDVELLIHVDRNLGLVSCVRVPRGATIAAVKAELSKEDSSMDPGSFGLKLPGSPDGECLPDDRAIAGLDALDFCPLASAPEEEAEEEAPQAAAKELQVTVHIDRALGLQTQMALRPGSRIFAVKEQLAEADPTGSTKPEDFGLRLPGSGDGPDGLLDDALPITGDMSELDVCLPSG